MGHGAEAFSQESFLRHVLGEGAIAGLADYETDQARVETPVEVPEGLSVVTERARNERGLRQVGCAGIHSPPPDVSRTAPHPEAVGPETGSFLPDRARKGNVLELLDRLKEERA
jgi:hypothetical protein